MRRLWAAGAAIVLCLALGAPGLAQEAWPASAAPSEAPPASPDHSGHPVIGLWMEGERAPFTYTAYHPDGMVDYFDPTIAVELGLDDGAVVGFGQWRPTGERSLESSIRLGWLDTTVSDVVGLRARSTVGEDGMTLVSELRQSLARSVPALSAGDLISEQRLATTAQRLVAHPGVGVPPGDHHGHAAVGVWVEGDEPPYVYHLIHADGTALSLDPLVAASLDLDDRSALRFGAWEALDAQRIALLSRSAWLDPAIDRVVLSRAELAVNDTGDTISGTGESALLDAGDTLLEMWPVSMTAARMPLEPLVRAEEPVPSPAVRESPDHRGHPMVGIWGGDGYGPTYVSDVWYSDGTYLIYDPDTGPGMGLGDLAAFNLGTWEATGPDSARMSNHVVWLDPSITDRAGYRAELSVPADGASFGGQGAMTGFDDAGEVTFDFGFYWTRPRDPFMPFEDAGDDPS